MKLTWFGGSTFRIHIGGQIIVTDAARAEFPVDVTELRSGADKEIELGGDPGELPAIDAASWRPPRATTVLEEDAAAHGVRIGRIERQGLLLYVAGDSPLLLVGGTIGAVGRWSRDATVVLYGEAVQTPEQAVDLLERLSPKLLLLAAPEPQVEALFAALQARLGETALVALETGMALEA
jgi:hypothetical protein